MECSRSEKSAISENSLLLWNDLEGAACEIQQRLVVRTRNVNPPVLSWKTASRCFGALHGQVTRHSVDLPVLICMTLDLSEKKKEKKKESDILFA